MSLQRAAIDVEAGADLVAHHDRERSALVEVATSSAFAPVPATITMTAAIRLRCIIGVIAPHLLRLRNANELRALRRRQRRRDELEGDRVRDNLVDA